MKFRFLAIAISIALVGAVFIARSGPSVAPDFEKMLSFDGKPEIIVDIPAGSSGSAIARLLFDNGIIKSSESYFRVAVGDKRSETVAPGNHRLTLQISAKQALEQLLDADRIDGANMRQEFRYILIPSIKGEISIVLIITFTFALRNFDIVWNATQGGPGNSTNVPSLFIYKSAFVTRYVGEAAAASFLLAVLILIVTGILLYTRRESND